MADPPAMPAAAPPTPSPAAPTFDGLGLDPRLLRGVHRLGLRAPTPVQVGWKCGWRGSVCGGRAASGRGERALHAAAARRHGSAPPPGPGPPPQGVDGTQWSRTRAIPTPPPPPLRPPPSLPRFRAATSWPARAPAPARRWPTSCPCCTRWRPCRRARRRRGSPRSSSCRRASWWNKCATPATPWRPRRGCTFGSRPWPLPLGGGRRAAGGRASARRRARARSWWRPRAASQR